MRDSLCYMRVNYQSEFIVFLMSSVMKWENFMTLQSTNIKIISFYLKIILLFILTGSFCLIDVVIESD